ncbi:MAG: hypothetical protein U0X93_11845 [Anaerolineales bacterium]
MTEEFEVIRDKLAIELQQALAGADVLIAHNVCSLNKNLALTAALHQLRQTDFRLILWHHDLAWTTPRYLHELPKVILEFASHTMGNLTHVVVSELRRDELAELMSIEPASIASSPMA